MFKLKKIFYTKINRIKDNYIEAKNIIRDKNIFSKIINYIFFILKCVWEFKSEILIVISVCILIMYLFISVYSKKYIYNSIEKIPYNDVALVL